MCDVTFICSQSPPSELMAHFRGLLKLNGLRGDTTDADAVVTLFAGVVVGQWLFRQTSDLYAFWCYIL